MQNSISLIYCKCKLKSACYIDFCDIAIFLNPGSWMSNLYSWKLYFFFFFTTCFILTNGFSAAMVNTKKVNTSVHHLLCFTDKTLLFIIIIIFYKLKVCGNPALIKPIGTVSATVFAYLCLCVTFW